MRVTWIVALVVLLVASTTALAARGDPKREITRADQARAKAVVLRRADLNPAFVARPVGPRTEFYCAALDESDLTLSGEARSPSFTAGPENVSSFVVVYRSRAEADASWRRGTSAAGMRCLRSGLLRQLGPPLGLLSFGRRAFPDRGGRSLALRAVVNSRGLRFYIDTIVMQVARMQVGLVYTTALSPPPEGELRRLTARLASRAARQMRA